MGEDDEGRSPTESGMTMVRNGDPGTEAGMTKKGGIDRQKSPFGERAGLGNVFA